jgi:hypothetical protein
MTTTTRNTTSASPVPLAVWAVGHGSSQDQRATNQDTGCIEQPDSIELVLAQTIVKEYSKSRGLVIDLAGGPVVVEAAASHCPAIGIWPDDELTAIARTWRQNGEPVDLPAAVLPRGVAPGLLQLERNMRRLAGLHGDPLVPQTSFCQLQQIRKGRPTVPLIAIVTEDALVLKKFAL